MITNINDYLPKLQEMFPYLKPKDIKRMVEYGWRMLYFYNLRGCDTLIESSTYKYWMYCGNLCVDSLKHFKYYIAMLRRKLRVLYAKRKIQWDGYYYTSLSEEEYKEIFKSKSKKKVNFILYNKLSFKIFDEAKIYYLSSKYIVRFKYLVDMGYCFNKEKLKCTNVEVVFTREKPDTFKDIMISNYNYDLI